MDYRVLQHTILDNGEYKPVSLALMRRTMPTLFANKVVGVQPMAAPAGLAFAMRTTFDGPKLFVDASYNQLPDTFNEVIHTLMYSDLFPNYKVWRFTYRNNMHHQTLRNLVKLQQDVILSTGHLLDENLDAIEELLDEIHSEFGSPYESDDIVFFKSIKGMFKVQGFAVIRDDKIAKRWITRVC